MQQGGCGDGPGGLDAQAVSLVAPFHGGTRRIIGEADRFGDQPSQDGPVVLAHVVGEQAITDAGGLLQAHAFALVQGLAEVVGAHRFDADDTRLREAVGPDGLPALTFDGAALSHAHDHDVSTHGPLSVLPTKT